jgi:hypothetical protein
VSFPHITCQKCGSIIAQNDTDEPGAGWCVRTKILKVGSTGVHVRCRHCGELVKIPLVEPARERPPVKVVVRRAALPL